MTITSPDHALAYAHICDLMRTAAASRRVPSKPRRHRIRSAAAGALHWLQHGQLGAVTPCRDC